MKLRGLVAMVSGAVIVVGGCSGPTSPSMVSSISLTGPTFFSAVGETGQLTAEARLADGTSSNVTDQASWQSSNNAVATVSAAGFVTVEGFGAADITCTYHGGSGMISVLAVPPPFLAGPQRSSM
jgi:uncharacterized protein YjdB